MPYYGIARMLESGDSYASMPGRYETFEEAKDAAGHMKAKRPAVSYFVTENGNICVEFNDQ